VKRLPTRVLVAVGLLIAFALAGVVSYYASDSPDGLNRVAEDHGIADQEAEPLADSPLAGYGDDPRVGGIIGAVIVLVLASGTVYLVRRRAGGDERSHETTGGG
jgi:cobalt/nickel transport protein